ncbi:MAG: DegT/DnrJ/EryC1/StrS family aminotransferase [Oligosphaeraceae bacterium]|nr:DegT/DnrJ/EryC1/StrS family aminotransferase [Oligosphaeraceae bacterium]
MKLAIEGGKPVFEKPARVPPWPPIYPETTEKLKEVYLSRKWSFYSPLEIEFNERFAEYTGAAGCCLMANGTVTLEMALLALGVGPGDEVIVPAHTWIATGAAVVFRGATPVIVDIENDTLCMDPDHFEEAITPKTKAVIPVHLFGSMADIDRINAIAKKHGIAVIEDCAHAHGGEWDGRHVGTFGDVGSFSFQQSKTMASGEGGACITQSAELNETLGRLSHIGYQYAAKQGKPNTPPPEGLLCRNYRLTDFQAAILLDQLKHLKEDTLLRARNAEFLRKRLDAIPGIHMQSRGRKTTLQSYYKFALTLDPAVLRPGITKTNVQAALIAEGVRISGGWSGIMHKQRLWTVPKSMYRIASCENAERIVSEEILCFDVDWLMIPQEDLELCCQAFEKVMSAYLK